MAGGSFEVDLRGVDQLTQLGKDLKAAGNRELRKELLAAGRRTAKPIREKVREHALSDLPHRGGLNVWVASKTKVTAVTRLTGKNVGVRVKMRHPGERGLSDLPAINDGRVRHPLFGERDVWLLQRIQPGFAARAMDEIGDVSRDEFLAAVESIAARLAAGG